MPQVYPDFSTSFANLGTAMFGDPSLIVAGQRSAAERAYREGMLDNAAEELRLKAPLYQAQAAQANAAAAENTAQAEARRMQTKGSTELGDVFRQALIPDASGQVSFRPDLFGRAAAAAAQANPTGDVSKLVQSFAAMSIQQNPAATEDALRRAAAMTGDMPTAQTAFTTGQVQQLENNELTRRVAVQQAANQVDYSKPVIVPDGSSVFALPKDPRFPQQQDAFAPQPMSLNTSAAPQSSVADVVAPVPSRSVAPYRDPASGAIVVPKQGTDDIYTPAKQAAFMKEFSDAGMAAESALAAIQPLLNNKQLLEMSVNPVGGVPALGSLYRWGQAASNDPGLMAALRVNEAAISDWLSKSSQLKGAITERETAMLRASQPPENASAEQKLSWLQNVAWHMQREAAFAADRQRAVQRGGFLPVPQDWIRAYQEKNPMPNMLGPWGNASGASPSLAPAVAPNASQEAMIPVIAPDGQTGSIPASQLQEALAAGYKQR